MGAFTLVNFVYSINVIKLVLPVQYCHIVGGGDALVVHVWCWRQKNVDGMDAAVHSCSCFVCPTCRTDRQASLTVSGCLYGQMARVGNKG